MIMDKTVYCFIFLEIFLAVAAGKKDNFGKFPKDSVHGKVYAKLKSFAQLSSIKI